VKSHIIHSFEGIESARVDAKLLDIARAAGEQAELRKSAIRTLGNKKGAAAVETLTQLYRSETNREIREQALVALSDIEDPRADRVLVEVARAETDTELRRFAIHRLGDREGASGFEELSKLYQTERDREVKKDILRAFGHMENSRARELVAQAARTETDRELRQAAVHVIGDDEENPQSIETLVSLYDAERDAEVKSEILDALANTEQKRALRKVMDVARRDPNMELRKKAVGLLGRWEDPEAAKFLEEILKP
jgi:HEAT repeat protein